MTNLNTTYTFSYKASNVVEDGRTPDDCK